MYIGLLVGRVHWNWITRHLQDAVKKYSKDDSEPEMSSRKENKQTESCSRAYLSICG